MIVNTTSVLTTTISNVIQFPREKWKTPSQTMDEVYESITESRKEHIQILVNLLMEYLTYKVCDEGFDITLDECEPSYIMCCEAIESLLSRSVGIHHPIQDIALETFANIEEENNE